MPYNKDAFSRYKLIDQRIRQKQKTAPTLEQLIEYVSDKLGKTVSPSSIQKDLQAMRQDVNLGFLAPIVYDRYTKGYKYSDDTFSIDKMNISDDELQGLEMALGILQQFKSVPAIKYFEEAISKMASAVKKNRDSADKDAYFLLDRPAQYAGAEYMPILVEAIREKNVLKIDYQGFNKPIAKLHTVHPYFIKEYESRLYLIANDVAPGKAQKFLTFSFDRIVGVKSTYDSFKEEFVDKSNYYNHTLGISHVDKKPITIDLAFHPSQAGYLKTQFFHHSQQIIEDNENTFKIRLLLVMNMELKMRILSFGSLVKVISPKELITEIKEEIDKTKLFYK